MFGWILSVLTLLQFLLYGFDNVFYGPLYSSAIAIVWMAYCWRTKQHGLQLLNVGSFLINQYNFWGA